MNVKPGDLARLVNGGVNHGAQVFVLESHDTCPCGKFSWETEILQTMKVEEEIFGFPVRTKTVFPGEHVWIHDEDLRRIDPPPEEESTTTDKELQA